MGIGAALSGFVTFLGSGTAAAAIAATAIRIGAAVGISALLAKKPGRPGIQARTLTTKGTLDAQQLIYGQALGAGSLAYRAAHGRRNSELWAAHCLAGHEVDDITDVWLDNKVIADSLINGGASTGGAVTSGTYGPTRGTVNTVEVWKKLGTDTQTVETNLDAASTEWTSAHRLRGIAYAVTMFKLNDRTEAVWEAGDPGNVKFLIRGKKIYDPRLDSTQTTLSPPGSGTHRVSDPTTWAWSDNPALCLADYLRDDVFSPFPGGIDQSRISWQSVVDAADDCDTLVAIPTSSTEKRFTCNGVLYGTANPEENVSAILSSMNGELIFSGGRYYIRAGVYESPVDTLNEDDIVGEIGVTSALESDKRFNTLKVAYIDKDKLYEPTETAEISIAAYVARDGGDRLVENVELSMTDSWYMAQRLALKRLTMANQELQITVPCNLKAARLVPGERVSLTVTERGWMPKVFKVLDWELFDRGENKIGVNLMLQEDDSSAYADPAEGDYNTISPGGTLTFADPEPIPSVDSIPRGIQYGVGGWNIELRENEITTGANDGEVLFTAGTYVLPDGTVRTLSSDAAVNTPYESSITPPDGSFYLIWGATNPDTRFSVSNWGDTASEAAGLFAAIYDRINEQWYAVDNSNAETAFTPAATDVAVARGVKTSTTGGIDSLTALVAYVEDPRANATAPPNALTPGYADFESLPAGESGYFTASLSSTTMEVTTAQAYLGTKSATFNGGATGGGMYSTGAKLGLGTYHTSINPNRRWLLIAWVRSTLSGANVQGQLVLGDGSFVTGSAVAVSAANTWEQMAWELDATASAEITARYRFSASNLTAGNNIYIDGVMLIDVTNYPSYTASNYPTEFYPAATPPTPITVTVDPPGLVWDTYEAGGWSPADTTRAVTVKFWRGSTEIASRILDATLTDSGVNEGDIAVAAGTSTGDATTVSLSGNNTASVLATVTHTDSGVQTFVSFGSALPGYSGGVTK